MPLASIRARPTVPRFMQKPGVSFWRLCQPADFHVHKKHGFDGYFGQQESVQRHSSTPSSDKLMNRSDSLWHQIIEPIEDRMIRSVWRITRSAQDAEDAMQNALVAIWKHQRESRGACFDSVTPILNVTAGCCSHGLTRSTFTLRNRPDSNSRFSIRSRKSSDNTAAGGRSR